MFVLPFQSFAFMDVVIPVLWANTLKTNYYTGYRSIYMKRWILEYDIWINIQRSKGIRQLTRHLRAYLIIINKITPFIDNNYLSNLFVTVVLSQRARERVNKSLCTSVTVQCPFPPWLQLDVKRNIILYCWLIDL